MTSLADACATAQLVTQLQGLCERDRRQVTSLLEDEVQASKFDEAVEINGKGLTAQVKYLGANEVRKILGARAPGIALPAPVPGVGVIAALGLDVIAAVPTPERDR